jgi:hypothetical protein
MATRHGTQGDRPRVSTVIVDRQVVVKVDCPRCGRRYSDEIPLAFRRDGESNMTFAFRQGEHEKNKHFECTKGDSDATD